MPLPIILGAGAAIAGIAGVASGVTGAKKMKDANDTMKEADSRHKNNIKLFEEQSKTTTEDMDVLGKNELDILQSFERFSKVFEQIQNKPEFKTYNKNGIDIPKYPAEELKKASVGAGVLLGGIGGAAVGTAGGFAAAGATTSAVMALGTASTGTAIATLSGAAATNATLAAIGGGAIAAGGGGIALGTTILGAATLGVGLLVGGVVFNVTGGSLSNKADEAYSQMLKAEEEMVKIRKYLRHLSVTAKKYNIALTKVNEVYKDYMNKLIYIVEVADKTEWNDFLPKEKLVTENTALLVNLLFNMCKVQLVLASGSATETNKVNTTDVDKSINDSKVLLKEMAIA